ncbi:hypothetical protein KJ877_01585 [bacterium]|nr:hypothetical protein [bacterium]MBU1989955.1 hypothetical protein [bacterium]
MNLYTVVFAGIVLSIIFHFVGVYAQAKKTVWVMLALIWIGSISFALNEISPKGYTFIDKINGEYQEVDAEIEASKPEISLYEMLVIKKMYEEHKTNSSDK